MLSNRPCAYVVAIALLLFAGCAMGGKALKPVRTVAVTIEPENKTRSIDVQPLTQVDITLPPTVGEQVWQIAFHDARYLKQVSEIVPAKVPGGGATVSFVTINPGRGIRTRLRFLLLPRSGAREVAPMDEQELVLSVQY